MPELALERLDLQPRHLALLRELLRQHLSQADVWAYGSRVNGDGHEASDLDLVVRQPGDLKRQTPRMEDVREILVDSDLPIRVDIVDWARIPVSFHGEIERGYVVVQRGRGGGTDPAGIGHA